MHVHLTRHHVINEWRDYRKYFIACFDFDFPSANFGIYLQEILPWLVFRFS